MRPAPRSHRPRLASLLVPPVLALAGTAVLSASCTATPTPTTTSTTTGVVTDVGVEATVGGFHQPWEIAFLPDGTPLVTERPGTLASVSNGARHQVSTVPGVVAQGEGGLLGLAIDPAFSTNRWIYMCHAYGTGGTVIDVRVVRYRLAEDLGSITGGTTLLSGINSGAGNRHLGCRVRVGPDQMLWVSTGDAAVWSNPQDPASLAGKVLRMTLAGAPAPGNPGGTWNPYVYTIGHRNPQGLAFRPSDGAAFEVEHGTGCDDEVNHLAAGANYGWAPGPAGGYDESSPMTFAGGTPALWSSGCPTIAPSGATFVAGAQWGGWNQQLAVAVLKGSRLMFVRIDGTNLAGVDFRLTDRGRLRTVQQGPDGRLWVAQDANPGSLLVLAPR